MSDGPDMRKIVAQPLTGEAFAGFGSVGEAPATAGRIYLDATLRPGAWASLSVSRLAPLAGLPIRAETMERHEFSSQTIVPLNGARWLVVVAPHLDGQDRPDMSRARAFLPEAGQSVTYAVNVWHHPMTALDAPADFAVLMWRDGTSTDEQFVPVEPFLVTASRGEGAGP